MHQQSLSLKSRVVSIKIHYLSMVLLCVCFYGCRQSKDITLDIVAPNWQNSERVYYGVMRGDSMIGRASYSVYPDMEGDTPVYILDLLTEAYGQESFIWDTSVVCFRRKEFYPIWAWRKVVTDLGYSIMSTRYSNSNAEIWRETIDGRELIRIKFNNPCFDNEMILTMLRAVRFKVAKNYTFSVIIPISSEKITNEIRYSGKTKVTTPAGSFECDKVTITYRDRKFYACYEQKEPRRLIHYQEKDSNVSLVLLKDQL